MIKTCAQCKTDFIISEVDQGYYKRLAVPLPTHCPSCRYQRRMAWRNERCFFQRRCNLCTKPIISVYHPRVQRPVYCSTCWWSDQWDAQTYAQAINWSEPFFPQYARLLERVPALALMNDNGAHSDNCEYTYDFSFGKDAYMVISAWHVENAMYGHQVNRVKDVYDSYLVYDAELIYEGSMVAQSYRCAFVQQVRNCRDITFGFDLQGCSDCILSAGLRNKRYCIWNVEYTREEYQKRKEALQLHSQSNLQRYQREFDQFVLTLPRRYADLFKCTDCTGNGLLTSQRSYDCYNANNLTDCHYFQQGDIATDCYDVSNSGKPELCYESIAPDESYHNLFTMFCWQSKFLNYSENCHASENLFGCVGLRSVKNAILNKVYSASDYKMLSDKLIQHMNQTREWGEFFPMSLSPFAYNESVAQIIKPLTVEAAQIANLRWSDDLPFTTGKETIAQLPDTIAETPAEITQAILRCTRCQRNYKIQPAEYKFYQTWSLPLSPYCPECRYQARLQRLPSLQLWHRQCLCMVSEHSHGARCPQQFETPYAPNRPELIYCADCYQAEMY